MLALFRSIGADIVDRVIVGTAQWSELFQKHDFFHKYRHYLQVIASTGTPEQHIKWYVTRPHVQGILMVHLASGGTYFFF